MIDLLAALDRALGEVREAGGAAGGHGSALGVRQPRDRIDLLVDRDTAFLELCPLAGWGTGSGGPAGVVGGLGTVAGVTCIVTADLPGVAADDPWGPAKAERLAMIATGHRLPLVHLAAGGTVTGGTATATATDVACRAEVFLPGHGYPPGRADHRVAVRPPGGPPTYPVSDVDTLAYDDRDAIRLVRTFIRRVLPAGPGSDPVPSGSAGPVPHQTGPADRTGRTYPGAPGTSDMTGSGGPASWPMRPAPRTGPPPRHDPEDLLAVIDGAGRYDPREVLARVLDGSEFDEFQPHRKGCVAGWGELSGYPVAVLADQVAGPGDATAAKAAGLLRFARGSGVPVLVLRGARTRRPVPTPPGNTCLTVLLGGAEEAGYGHRSGFSFSWPASGPALRRSGRLLDDAVIDPRDTRTVLSLTLAALAGTVPTAATPPGGTVRPGRTR